MLTAAFALMIKKIDLQIVRNLKKVLERSETTLQNCFWISRPHQKSDAVLTKGTRS